MFRTRRIKKKQEDDRVKKRDKKKQKKPHLGIETGDPLG